MRRAFAKYYVFVALLSWPKKNKIWKKGGSYMKQSLPVPDIFFGFDNIKYWFWVA